MRIKGRELGLEIPDGMLALGGSLKPFGMSTLIVTLSASRRCWLPSVIDVLPICYLWDQEGDSGVMVWLDAE